MPATKPSRPVGPPRPAAPRYKVQHGLIVLCEGEAEQRRLYTRLAAMGLRVRVVVT